MSDWSYYVGLASSFTAGAIVMGLAKSHERFQSLTRDLDVRCRIESCVYSDSQIIRMISGLLLTNSPMEPVFIRAILTRALE